MNGNSGQIIAEINKVLYFPEGPEELIGIQDNYLGSNRHITLRDRHTGACRAHRHRVQRTILAQGRNGLWKELPRDEDGDVQEAGDPADPHLWG